MTTTYCTLDPDHKSSELTLSGGNLVFTHDPSAAYGNVLGDLSFTGGKWYFEITLSTSSPYLAAGWGTIDTGLDAAPGGDVESWAVHFQYGYAYHEGYIGTIYKGVVKTAGDVAMIACDLDNGKMWVGKSGTWAGSPVGDPATGANPHLTGISGTLFPFVGLYMGNAYATVNFGASAFAYTPPSGFSAVYQDTGISNKDVSELALGQETIVIHKLKTVSDYAEGADSIDKIVCALKDVAEFGLGIDGAPGVVDAPKKSVTDYGFGITASPSKYEAPFKTVEDIGLGFEDSVDKMWLKTVLESAIGLDAYLIGRQYNSQKQILISAQASSPGLSVESGAPSVEAAVLAPTIDVLSAAPLVEASALAPTIDVSTGNYE
jgi:hypothetical protein